MEVDAPAGPRYDRRRLLAAVAIAVVAGFVTLALAQATRSGGPSVPPQAAPEPLRGRPPLAYHLADRYMVALRAAKPLAALTRLGDPTRDGQLALALAQAHLAAGDVTAAGASLDDAANVLGEEDQRVQVGRALVAYDPASPTAAVDRLGALAADHPNATLPAFALGVAQLWSGRRDEATQTLDAIVGASPDSPYAALADNVLHPEQVAGYPLWVPSLALAAGTALRRASDLQHAGRREAARRAAVEAVQDAPQDLDAQVAVAVLGYRKDDPASTFGALGNLIRSNPDTVDPVFHLAELLLWIKADSRAISEYRKAARLDPGGPLGRIAAAVVRNLTAGAS